MMSNTYRKPKPHKTIEFYFQPTASEDPYKGTVLLREKEMVIDIPIQDDEGPYLIVGKFNGRFYEGKNSAHDAHSDVYAKWGDFGDIYIGQWIEDSDEYLFSFKISKI